MTIFKKKGARIEYDGAEIFLSCSIQIRVWHFDVLSAYSSVNSLPSDWSLDARLP